MWAFAFFLAGIVWLLLFRKISGNMGFLLLFSVFAAGVISGPIAGSVTHLIKEAADLNLLQGSLHSFVLYFFVVGPFEELFKFMAVFFAARSSMDFRSTADGILLAVAGALGFASGENVLYMYVYGEEETLGRLFFSNVGHSVFAAIWGYGLGASMHENAGFRLLAVSFVISSAVHGAYNFFLTFHWLSAVLILGLTALSLPLLISLMKSEKKRAKI